MNNNKFFRIFLPPTLLLNQISSILFFSYLIGWKKLYKWIFTHSVKSIPVAAGAIGMGCIGFPNHPVFEITNRCNLKCIHCHAQKVDSNNPNTEFNLNRELDKKTDCIVASDKCRNDFDFNNKCNELSTNQVKQIIDDLRKIKEFRMLVFTGGEPLIREDLFEILNYSKQKGFINVVATNATLITDKVALDLKKAGVAGIAVSLDSTSPKIHNQIRQNKNAFELAIRGINAIKKAGILLQINTTAMNYNFNNLEDLVKYTDKLGGSIMLMYQLVPVGRGCTIKDATLDKTNNEKLATFLSEIQKKSSVLVETVAEPQYWAFIIKNKFFRNYNFDNILNINNNSKSSYNFKIKDINKSLKNNFFNFIFKKIVPKFFYGCTAGRGLLYIKPNGDVWPCPFFELNTGNAVKTPIDKIWKDSKIFNNLRNREKLLKGKCSNCDFNSICGGCRGRAFELTGDYLSQDDYCFII